MYLDYQAIFDDNAPQITNGSTASTNYVDMLAAGDAITPGARAVVRISTAYVDAGGLDIYVKLQCDDNSSFSSAKDLAIGPTITIAAGAATAAGAVGITLLDIVIPPRAERYLRILYVLTAASDAGSVDAYVTLDSTKLQDKPV